MYSLVEKNKQSPKIPESFIFSILFGLVCMIFNFYSSNIPITFKTKPPTLATASVTSVGIMGLTESQYPVAWVAIAVTITAVT